jgi:hypothetical protein
MLERYSIPVARLLDPGIVMKPLACAGWHVPLRCLTMVCPWLDCAVVPFWEEGLEAPFASQSAVAVSWSVAPLE